MNRLRELFYGKRVFDALNKAIAATGLLFLILSSVFDMAALSFVFLICLIVFVSRAVSPDLKARSGESAAFMRIPSAAASFFRLRLRMLRETGTHKYFRCVSCRMWLRVPRGKGKISVRCSKCGISMIKSV